MMVMVMVMGMGMGVGMVGMGMMMVMVMMMMMMMMVMTTTMKMTVMHTRYLGYSLEGFGVTIEVWHASLRLHNAQWESCLVARHLCFLRSLDHAHIGVGGGPYIGGFVLKAPIRQS